MTPSPAPANGAARRGTGLAVTGLVLLLLGGAIALIAGVRLVGGLIEALDVQSARVPGSATVVLEPGPYTVYSLEGSARFAPSDVSVTGPDGGAVTVGAVTARETLTLGPESYLGVVGFRAQTAGPYTVTVAPTAPDGRLVVSRTVWSTLAGTVGWIVALSIAAVTVLLGLALGITGLVQRGSRTRAPATAPAGWYPDPHDPAAQRYWDGAAWTEHRA